MGGHSKAELLERIDRERDAWRTLVAEVGSDRMEEPGPMGEWSFKDLAAHLLGWRERTIARLEAAGGGPPAAERFWPADVADDDDAVNDWIHAQHRDRPAAAILADVDASYGRLRNAVERLDEEAVTDPDRFPWLEGQALAEVALFSHLHDEHEPTIREWLATRAR
jgi:uncharacterized protein (TIGR03083 family)